MSYSTCSHFPQTACQGPASGPFHPSFVIRGHPGITAPQGVPAQLIPNAFERADIKALPNKKLHLQSTCPRPRGGSLTFNVCMCRQFRSIYTDSQTYCTNSQWKDWMLPGYQQCSSLMNLLKSDLTMW